MITQLFPRFAFGAALIVGAVSVASAQDSGPLIDALVRKGVLTDQEGEDLRADLLRDFGSSSAGKLDLSSSVTRLRISGDARIRYQFDNDQGNGNPDYNGRARYRYRLRFGAVANLGPKWSAGFRLETNSSATSTNNDLGSGTDNFSKSTDTINIGQVFVQYNDTQVLGDGQVDLRFGKFGHKFFNPGVNGFWIDSDINFEGLAQELAYEDLIGNVDLAVRAGQFILNANSTAGNVAVNTPSTLFITQAELSNLKSGAGWRVAPTFVLFAAPSAHDATGIQANDTSIYTDLATVLLPAEFTFKLKNGKPLTAYATYGFNFSGEERADRLYGAQDSSSYDQMFNLGLRYGGLKEAGDYQLTAEYRYVEAGAYTSILLDSDFNTGRLGGAGPILSASYNFTEAVTATITYFNAFNIDDDQVTNADAGLGFGQAQVLQVDLSAKF